MIKSLLIRNFQSHKFTHLDFDKGVNVICGLSQAGKTAVLRAFRLLVYNRPSGARFYSNFAPREGMTEVQAELDNARVTILKEVKRGKDGKKVLKGTVYGLDRDNDHLDWSPGTDVPTEVQLALHMGEMNIQSQFDRPFLIMAPPGEIARTINKITRLEQVDGWKAELSKRINQKTQEIKVVTDQMKTIEQTLVNYKGFEDLGETINNLTIVDNRLSMLSHQSEEIDSSLQVIERAQKSIDSWTNALDQLEDICSLVIQMDDELKKAKDKRDIIEHIDLLDRDLDYMGGVLKDLMSLRNLLTEERYRNSLDNALSDIEFTNKEIEADTKEYEKMKARYMELIKQDKKCPVCFAPIDAKTIKRIEGEL